MLLKKKSWKWPNELSLRTLQHAIFDNAQLIRWALNFSIRRSNSRVSQSIFSREKKKNSASVARMWKVKSASSSLRFLSVKGYIHHHLKRISGYSAKQRTPKWEIFRVFSLCIYSKIRLIEHALRVFESLSLPTWGRIIESHLQNAAASIIRTSPSSSAQVSILTTVMINFFLIIDLYCV